MPTLEQTFVDRFQELSKEPTMYPNVRLSEAELRPGSILKTNRLGLHQPAGTIYERAKERHKERQHIAQAMERVTPRAASSAFPPASCELRSEGVTIGDMRINERAPLTRAFEHCNLLVKFELANDTLFSLSDDSVWFEFSEVESKTIWPVAKDLLHDDEALVVGVAYTPQLIAWHTHTPGAVLGITTDGDLNSTKLDKIANVARITPLHVQAHYGEVLMLDAKDCIAMYKVRTLGKLHSPRGHVHHGREHLHHGHPAEEYMPHTP
jgi:hypothetical protein